MEEEVRSIMEKCENIEIKIDKYKTERAEQESGIISEIELLSETIDSNKKELSKLQKKHATLSDVFSNAVTDSKKQHQRKLLQMQIEELKKEISTNKNFVAQLEKNLHQTKFELLEHRQQTSTQSEEYKAEISDLKEQAKIKKEQIELRNKVVHKEKQIEDKDHELSMLRGEISDYEKQLQQKADENEHLKAELKLYQEEFQISSNKKTRSGRQKTQLITDLAKCQDQLREEKQATEFQNKILREDIVKCQQELEKERHKVKEHTRKMDEHNQKSLQKLQKEKEELEKQLVELNCSSVSNQQGLGNSNDTPTENSQLKAEFDKLKLDFIHEKIRAESECKELAAELGNCKQQLEVVHNEKLTAERNLAGLAAELANHKENERASEKKLEQLKNEADNQHELRVKAVSEKEEAKITCSELKRDLSKFQEESKEKTLEIEKLNEKVASYEDIIKKTQKEKGILEAENSKLNLNLQEQQKYALSKKEKVEKKLSELSNFVAKIKRETESEKQVYETSRVALKKEIEKYQEQLLNVNSENEKLDKELAQCKEALAKNEIEKNTFQEKIEELNGNAAKQLDELLSLTKGKNESEEEITKLKDCIEKYKVEMIRENEKFHHTLKTAAAKHKEEIRNALDENKHIKKELAKLGDDLLQYKRKLISEKKSFEKSLAEITPYLDKYKEQLKNLSIEKEKLLKEINQLKSTRNQKLLEAVDKNTKLENDLKELQNTVAKLQQEIVTEKEKTVAQILELEYEVTKHRQEVLQEKERTKYEISKAEEESVKRIVEVEASAREKVKFETEFYQLSQKHLEVEKQLQVTNTALETEKIKNRRMGLELGIARGDKKKQTKELDELKKEITKYTMNDRKNESDTDLRKQKEHFDLDMKKVKLELESVIADQTQLRESLVTVVRQKEKFQSESEKLKSDVKTLEAHLEAKKRSEAGNSHHQKEMAYELLRLKEEITNYKQQFIEDDFEINGLRTRVEELNSEISSQKQQVVKDEDEKTKLKNELNQLQEKIEKYEIEKYKDSNNKNEKQLLADLSRYKEQLNIDRKKAKIEIEQLRANEIKLKEKFDKANIESSMFKTNEAKLNEKLKKTDSKNKILEIENAQLKADLEEYEERLRRESKSLSGEKREKLEAVKPHTEPILPKSDVGTVNSHFQLNSETAKYIENMTITFNVKERLEVELAERKAEIVNYQEQIISDYFQINSLLLQLDEVKKCIGGKYCDCEKLKNMNEHLKSDVVKLREDLRKETDEKQEIKISKDKKLSSLEKENIWLKCEAERVRDQLVCSVSQKVLSDKETILLEEIKKCKRDLVIEKNKNESELAEQRNEAAKSLERMTIAVTEKEKIAAELAKLKTERDCDYRVFNKDITKEYATCQEQLLSALNKLDWAVAKHSQLRSEFATYQKELVDRVTQVNTSMLQKVTQETPVYRHRNIVNQYEEELFKNIKELNSLMIQRISRDPKYLSVSSASGKVSTKTELVKSEQESKTEVKKETVIKKETDIKRSDSPLDFLKLVLKQNCEKNKQIVKRDSEAESRVVIKQELLDVPDGVHTDDYKKIVERGINENVAVKLEEIIKAGRMSPSDLTEYVLGELKTLPVEAILDVLNKTFPADGKQNTCDLYGLLCNNLKTFHSSVNAASGSSSYGSLIQQLPDKVIMNDAKEISDCAYTRAASSQGSFKRKLEDIDERIKPEGPSVYKIGNRNW